MLLMYKRNDKISVSVVITHCIYRKSWGENSKLLYVLSDDNDNTFTLSFKSKSFKVGERWLLEGRVKEHKIFCNKKQIHIDLPQFLLGNSTQYLYQGSPPWNKKSYE